MGLNGIGFLPGGGSQFHRQGGAAAALPFKFAQVMAGALVFFVLRHVSLPRGNLLPDCHLSWFPARRSKGHDRPSGFAYAICLTY